MRWIRRLLLIGFVAQALTIAGTVSAQTIVPGQANPWLAGMPDGSTDQGRDLAPAQSPILVTSVDVSTLSSLTFQATGGAYLSAECPIPPTFPPCYLPDGGAVGFHNAIFPNVGGAANGIAGLRAPLNSLIGVFLDDNQPDSSAAPANLDFSSSALGVDFTTLSPLLKQPFFIGNGETSSATTQIFIVPQGATRLYLGMHDGLIWSNNSGQFEVFVSGTPSTTGVPLLGPTGFLILASALGVAGMRRALGVR